MAKLIAIESKNKKTTKKGYWNFNSKQQQEDTEIVSINLY